MYSRQAVGQAGHRIGVGDVLQRALASASAWSTERRSRSRAGNRDPGAHGLCPVPVMGDTLVRRGTHLAEIMINYIDHPENVEEQSYNARKRIEADFNWDDRDEQILNLLQL